MEDEKKTCFNFCQEYIRENWAIISSVSVFLLGIYVAKKAEKLATNAIIKY